MKLALEHLHWRKEVLERNQTQALCMDKTQILHSIRCNTQWEKAFLLLGKTLQGHLTIQTCLVKRIKCLSNEDSFIKFWKGYESKWNLGIYERCLIRERNLQYEMFLSLKMFQGISEMLLMRSSEKDLIVLLPFENLMTHSLQGNEKFLINTQYQHLTLLEIWKFTEKCLALMLWKTFEKTWNLNSTSTTHMLMQ